MKDRGGVVWCAICLTAGFAISSAPGISAQALQLQSTGRTVWDGAYSEAQAKRGEAVYAAECISCHGEDLSGQGSRLIGERFMRDWGEDNLNSLFRRTKAVMPRRAPGSLTDAQYLDVVAFILQQNEFPAGTQELSAETALSIQLVGKEGPQPAPEFSLVQIAGCLKESSGAWMLTNATDPRRSRTPDLTAEDLQAAVGRPLGSGTFRLLEALAYKPGANKDHKVMVKGLLIRRPDNRINVTALETIASSCE
jgi:S-disulfanyl-L-cysteine oxidoreductase SoxD